MESARINLFAIVGIGFMKQTRFQSGIASQQATSYGPLFDIGGGLEFVPDRRIAVRFGITDSVFRPPGLAEVANNRNKIDLTISLMLRP